MLAPTVTHRHALRLRYRAARVFVAIGVWLIAQVVVAETIPLRIEWGGGDERLWHGRVSLSAGQLSDPRALGLEADEPGSMWLDEHRLILGTRSVRVYDGVDVMADAAGDALLVIELSSERDKPLRRYEFRLSELDSEAVSQPLDETGNRLVVRRGPGHTIALKLPDRGLVFNSGERFRFEVSPIYPANATHPFLHATLSTDVGDRQVWNTDAELRDLGDGTSAAVPLDITLPDEEGVYVLSLEVVDREGTNLLRMPDPLGRRAPLASRQVQLVVVATKRPWGAARTSAAFDLLAEIDPANPSWRQRLPNLPVNVPWLTGTSHGTLGSGAFATRTHAGSRLVEIGDEAETELAWQAYPLPVAKPGQPHIVEVQYAADFEQSLGLSIVEPNAAGAVLPIGLDSGVYVTPATCDDGQPTATHRLIFWPRTNSPLLLIHNDRPGGRSLYGKIRLTGPRGAIPLTALGREPVPPTRLEPAFDPDEPLSDRMLAAYFDRPLFIENFSAPQAVDAISDGTGRTLRDWQTFYTGTTRMIEYLHHVGYNTAIISVAADGSSLYPSRLLEPTPRYDDGAFFSTGQDPIRKDVLDLMLRLCDRDRVQLIPAIEFAAPLPQLETLLRDKPEDAEGIALVGVDGRTWIEQHAPQGGLAPRYNPLDPRVQEAMLDVVRELAQRYGQHAALGGLALQLSADGYAQLPGIEWPLDERTMARFADDMHLEGWPSDKAQRQARVDLVLGKHRTAWLAWRARELAAFYGRVQSEVDSWHRGTRLYLLGADLFSAPDLKHALSPGLPRAVNIDELILHVGLDPQRYREPGNVVLLRPQRLGASGPVTAQAANLELAQSVELDRQFSDAVYTGSLFFHEPQETHLASFEAKSPFDPTYLRLVSESSPSSAANRRRFAHALATFDSQALVDGGWLLPLGQEDSLHDFIAAYRRLPARKFETLSPTSQPVVIRTSADRFRRYVYLVNDGPWPVTVSLSVEAPTGTQFESLGAKMPDPPTVGAAQTWTIELEPFALLAGAFSGPDVKLTDPKVTLPDEIPDQLDRHIHDLWARVAALKEPSECTSLVNPDFESSAARDGSVPGWQLAAAADAQARADRNDPKFGQQSLHLKAGKAGVHVESQPLPMPQTGRLSVSLWMRTVAAQTSPGVRIALVGNDGETEFIRYATLGQKGDDQKIADTWSQYVFQVHDVPAERFSRLHVEIDLLDAGEVWIDGVRLFDLDFSENERLELSKTITLAQYKRTNGELADCARLLESYWPRFLMSHVSPTGELASRPMRPATTTPQRDTIRAGMFDRMRGLVPPFLR